jgi:uncharacterized protein YndB with AHSA1/START domain
MPEAMPKIADRPDNVLRLERVFAGPPALVFALWTQPQFVSVWFGSSHGFRAEVRELDPRPGGYWRLVNRRGETTESPWGVYHEVEPGRRLLYSYFYEGTDFRSIVSIDLSPEGAGTRMRFCQTGFPDAESHREHGFGWPAAFGLFERALLAAHGIGASLPQLPKEALDGVARDMEAARRKYEEERQKQARNRA